jgi:hypothetical protein
MPLPGTSTISPSQYPIHKTNTLLYDDQEMSHLLTSEYNRRSIMSLDGIFSPISFYPTPYAATFAMTLYEREDCPYCNGNGTYTYFAFNQPQEGDETGKVEYLKNTMRQLVSINCLFCTPDTNAKEKERDKGAIPSLAIPPYLLVSDDDNTASINPDPISNYINKFTLNPIVTTNGEFSLNKYKKAGDGCGHGIDVVAYGETAPTQGASLRASTASSIGSNYGDDNKRFFGLRGPIMVHGWGYDKDGYPVPNGSGELVYNPQLDKWLSVTQKIQPDGSINEPYRTKTFYPGWAQQPGTWPVGPIDLRWDGEAGVWTVGSQYKNVWVKIEIDLVGTQPTRGIIIDQQQGEIPDGYRKLVFVKDIIGAFAAPRGAEIYCSYDTDSGFYAPLYNKALVTTGEFESNSTALIDQKYMSDYTGETYSTAFANPLNFAINIGAKGIFSYINGEWVLTSVK